MHPYQYMQYPGFVFPHLPVYPMDYRRTVEPRFHPPAWHDIPRQHRPQPHGRREMTCSEAQTDPSEAISKLIECLDKIRASELGGSERELDSGVASQSSGMFSPGEDKKSAEQVADHISPPVSDESRLQSPAVTFSNSTAAVYDGESSHRSLEVLSPQECWSGGFDEVLPLDSSSVHEEECPNLEQPEGDEEFLPLSLSENPKAEATDIQTDISVSAPMCNAEEVLKQRADPPTQEPSSDQSALSDTKCREKIPKPEHQAPSWDDAKTDPSYQILKLPFEGVLAAGAGRLSSPVTPYYYNYLSSQTAHERMSVLSPSLDELSSRDEMFSTDLEDMDLFPKHVYMNKRLAEVVGGAPEAAGETEGVWPMGSKRFVCACCGKIVAKAAGRSKGHGSKLYRDEAGDSDEDSRYRRGCEQAIRVVVRKHSAPRKLHPLPRHVSKPWYKRGQYKDPSGVVDQEEGHDVCQQESADGETGELASCEQQCRTCQDRLCRDDIATSDHARWGDGDVIPRRRRATSLQRQETRKTSCKSAMYHRPRDEENDDEELQMQWERGSTVRGEPRC
ncbi:hypothetical protein LDENG_00220170 [Lucifuga dentata]|nr:hypothetical protein LDENG_00220170 [Lucifuga dentata]